MAGSIGQREIILGQFTKKEPIAVLKEILKNRKAADPDKIPSEVWKTKKIL